jgi:hypothetical protein
MCGAVFGEGCSANKERDVSKSTGLTVLLSAMLISGSAAAQGMLLDAAADKVIRKFSTATCDELKAQKNEPPSEKEKLGIEFLRKDTQAREAFINRIAATVLNKMFECGMIP